MSLKHAVLGLVVDRPGHGYDLAGRLSARLGPAWKLTPSAVYFALDQLERAGLIRQSPVASEPVAPIAGRRRERVVYEATGPGADELARWLAEPSTRVDPVRSELYLKIAATPRSRATRLADLLHQEERAALRLHAASTEPVDDVRAELVRRGTLRRLDADLVWLRSTRGTL